MAKINFYAPLKDAFGEIITEPKSREEIETKVPIIIAKFLVNCMANPAAMPDGENMDAYQIVSRLTLQQKIAADKIQEFSPEEISIIRESVVTLFNKKQLPLEMVGAVLELTK